jgi:hypothetical protein
MQLIIAHARLPDFDTFTTLPSIPNMKTHKELVTGDNAPVPGPPTPLAAVPAGRVVIASPGW